MVRITRKPRWLALRPRRRRRLCWCRMKRRGRRSVGRMDFAADRRGIGRTARWESRGVTSSRTIQIMLALLRQAWTQLVARPETRYRFPGNTDLSEVQRRPRPPASSSPPLALRFCIFAAVRDVTRFFRLIENYGFTGERRCAEPSRSGAITRNASDISTWKRDDQHDFSFFPSMSFLFFLLIWMSYLSRCLTISS